MKIKTRDARIADYNKKYSKRVTDPTEAIKQYFKERGWNLDKAVKKASKKLDTIMNQREYEHIHIVMYEYPMKTDRPRSFNNHMYSPNAAANHSYFEKAVRKVIKTIQLVNTPAEIIVDAYLEMPKQVPPDEAILFEAKVLNVLDYPDYDNIGKCYTDMLKNVIITDDDIFHTGTISKYYSVTPRVEITIRYLKKHESSYIYKKLCGRKSIKQAIANGQLTLEKLENL